MSRVVMAQTCFVLLCLVASARAKMEGFIVGGSMAKIENHAYNVFLNVQCVDSKGKKTPWICGASVVNQLILLTAGHCLHTCTSESHIGINLGSENRVKGIKYATYSFVVHEDYDPKTSKNDIGLVRVENRIKLSSRVNRVALMRSPPYSEKAKVAGWGLTDEKRGTQGDMLKYVNQEVISRTDCLKIFKYLAKGTLCASSDSIDDFASQGDSGSALTVRGYIQIGLVSYKIPSISKHIVIYTDVGFFYDWIKTYAKELSCLYYK